MPRSWRRWAFGQDGKHAGFADGSAAFALVLHCLNTYKDGCSASEARQAVGEGRGAVVTGTHLAEAIHRLALWVGGLSTVGAICMRQTVVDPGMADQLARQGAEPMPNTPAELRALLQAEIACWAWW